MVAMEVRGHLRRADLEPVPDRRRTNNAAAIMLAALDYGPVARSTIARLAGLSPAAVSRQCAELIRRGLLREVPDADGVGVGGGGGAGGAAADPSGPAGPAGPDRQPGKPAGRPHVPVDVDTSGPIVCGVHIALRQATLALVDLRGGVVARERIPHDRGCGPDLVLGRLARRLPEFAAEACPGSSPDTRPDARPDSGQGTRRCLLGIGVAVGGWVDPQAGVIVDHPLLGWRNVPVRDLLKRQTGLPVLADGHARALVRAEQLFGDQRARSSVVHLFIGNVVDAAFAVGGTVQYGPRSAAGAVAHMPLPGRNDPCDCGRSGCLQAVVSDAVLAARAAADRVVPEPSFAALLAAAVAGNPRARAMFRQRARDVGTATALLIDMLNPEVVVVAEAGAMQVPGCLEELRGAVRRRSHGGGEPPIVATSFGHDVLPAAAGAVMLAQVFTDPLTS
jgi:predicted NBD/HSP70 family sugar kinase